MEAALRVASSMRIQTRLLLFAATGVLLVLVGGEAIGLSTAAKVGCAGFILFGAVFMAHSLAKPLRHLQRGAMRIGAGDWNTPIALERRDEFGELADILNRMAEDLKNLHTERDQATVALVHDTDLIATPLLSRQVVGIWVNDGVGNFQRAHLDTFTSVVPSVASSSTLSGLPFGRLLAISSRRLHLAALPTRVSVFGPGSTATLVAAGLPPAVADALYAGIGPRAPPSLHS